MNYLHNQNCFLYKYFDFQSRLLLSWEGVNTLTRKGKWHSSLATLNQDIYTYTHMLSLLATFLHSVATDLPDTNLPTLSENISQHWSFFYLPSPLDMSYVLAIPPHFCLVISFVPTQADHSCRNSSCLSVATWEAFIWQLSRALQEQVGSTNTP